jgi:hypothetical protein
MRWILLTRRMEVLDAFFPICVYLCASVAFLTLCPL